MKGGRGLFLQPFRYTPPKPGGGADAAHSIGQEAPATLDRLFSDSSKGDHSSFETQFGACHSQPQGLLCRDFGD